MAAGATLAGAGSKNVLGFSVLRVSAMKEKPLDVAL